MKLSRFARLIFTVVTVSVFLTSCSAVPSTVKEPASISEDGSASESQEKPSEVSETNTAPQPTPVIASPPGPAGGGSTSGSGSSAGDQGSGEALPLQLLAGSPVKVIATGFKSNSSVRVELHSTPVLLEEVISSADGEINEVVTIPGDAPEGEHHIVLEGVDDSNQPRTVEIPVDVIVNTGGITQTISGLVTNAEGQGLPYVLIRADRIDGGGSSTAQSDASGRYTINAPKGMLRISYEWMEYSETQREAASFNLPAAWKYTVSEFALLDSTVWNLELPQTNEVTVEIPDATYKGYVSIQPGLFENPVSQSFDIADGVSGSLEVGTVTGRYAQPGSPAIFDYFPISSAARIFVEGYFFGGTNHYRLGLGNTDISTSRTVSISPDLVALTLATSGSSVSPNYAHVVAEDGSFEANVYSVGSAFMVPRGELLTIDYGSINSGPTWQVHIASVSVSTPQTLTVSMPALSSLSVSFLVNGSSSFATGTSALSGTVVPIPGTTIPVDISGGVQGTLSNGFPNRPYDTGNTAWTTGGQGSSRTFNFFTPTNAIEGVSVTGRGSLDNNTYFTLMQKVTSSQINSGTNSLVLDLQTQGSLSGLIENSIGGVGITRVEVSNTQTGAKASGDSLSNGGFSIPAPIGATSAVVYGMSNIDPLRGVPRSWSLLIPEVSSLDVGSFLLPQMQAVTLQVLGPLGLPISNVQIREDRSGENNFVPLTSSTGVDAKLFNGFCPLDLGCDYGFISGSASATTDSNGLATLSRFPTGQLGTLTLTIPGSGPNAATTLIIDSSPLIGGIATITVQDRK